MKMRWAFLATFVLCSMLGFSVAKAAEPNKIKVGILLPLTGTFAAVAETQKQGALLAIDVVNKRGGLNMPWGKVTVEGVVDDDEAKLDVGVRRYRYHGFRRRQGRRRSDLGAARLCAQRHGFQGTDALLPDLRDGEGSVPERQARRFHLRRRLQPVDGRLHGRPVGGQDARQEARLLPRPHRQLGLGHARRRLCGRQGIRRRDRRL